MSDINEEQQQMHKARLRALTAAVVVLFAGATLLTMVAVGWLALQARNQSKLNYSQINEIKAVNQRLVDCTEIGGKCFEAGQRRTSEAVLGINEGTLYVIVSALSCQERGIVDQAELAICTVEGATKMAAKNKETE